METSGKQNVFTSAPWVTRSVGNQYLLSELVVYNLTEKHNTPRDICGLWSNFSGSHIDDRHSLWVSSVENKDDQHSGYSIPNHLLVVFPNRGDLCQTM